MSQEEIQDAVAARAEDVAGVVESSNHFATALYADLAAQSPGDLFFSPSSLTLALAMAYAGAGGETAREMAEALRFSLPPDRLHEAFRQLQESTRTGGVELRLANRLWGQSGYHFLPGFLRTTERCYRAGLAAVDFKQQADEARQEINAWVAEQTAGKIQNLLGPGTLGPMSRLVITNAIYFLGSWESEFDAADTTSAPFWSTPSKQQAVPTMRQTDRFRYHEFDDVQVLEMPYRRYSVAIASSEIDGQTYDEPVENPAGGSDMTMCILLPRAIDGLPAIEQKLSDTTLRKLATLGGCQVEVSLPRFRVECSFLLGDTLVAMGLRRAFSIEEADFSGMSDDPEGLFISSVLHKAVVDVNEKGTEAAAATGLAMFAGFAAAEPPKVFRADHPFLFVIRDRATGLIHFIGRVVSPSGDANEAK